MKKVISIILCVALLFGCTSAFAAESEKATDYPVIMIPGVASSPMYRIDEETGEKIHVWNIDINEILDEVKANIIPLGKALGDFTSGDVQTLADLVGESFIKLYGDLACNDDGSSVYDLKRYHSSAAETRDSVLIEGDDFCRFETEIVDDFAQTIGRDNIFHFACSFRMGAVECARELDEYIQEIKQLTGKDKVNIYAVSHGGQIAATYLALYGTKGDVYNAVLTVPAIGGAVLACDVLNGTIRFDEELLMRFVQFGMMYEEDYNLLLTADKLGILDPLLEAFVPYVHQILLNWCCIWDFVPVEHYEQLKNKLLDPEANAELIKKCDYMHYTVMPNIAKNFKKAQQAGTNISIIAGSNYPCVTGMQENSDGIISVNASTGAKTAPYGKRFSDGYIQSENTGLYQVSPGMEIDMSCGYLPYNTWIIDDLFHGMTIKDPYAFALAKKLIFTNDLKDVTSDPAFPQFHASKSRAMGVYAEFNKSKQGYLSSNDTHLVVTNTSDRGDMRILSICGNTGLHFDYLNAGVIAPGESINILFTGEVDSISLAKREITITYVLSNNITPLSERTLSFTVLNGENIAYDSENPLSPIKAPTTLESLAGEKLNKKITQYGLNEILNMLTNIVSSFVLSVFKYLTNVI